MPTSWEVWALCLVLKDSFWQLLTRSPWVTSIPFEIAIREEHHIYQTLFTLFFDHLKGMGVDVNSRSVIKMRIEKGESTDHIWDLKKRSNNNHSYDAWCQKMLAIRGFRRPCSSQGWRRLYLDSFVIDHEAPLRPQVSSVEVEFLDARTSSRGQSSHPLLQKWCDWLSFLCLETRMWWGWSSVEKMMKKSNTRPPP